MSLPLSSARLRVAAVLRHLQPTATLRHRCSVPWSSRSGILTPNAVFSTSVSRRAAAATAASTRRPLLPPQSEKDKGRLTVVLDMDETLLHSSLAPLPVGSDPRSVSDHADAESARLGDARKRPEHSFVIGEGKGRELVRSSLRPGLVEFLQRLDERFEPILFTSALPIYASPLLDLVEKDVAAARDSVSASAGSPTPDAAAPAAPRLFRHRLYRSATVPALEFDYDYVKDIRLLGRDMRRTVLIDNSVHACVHSPDNCVVVPDYVGAREDRVFEPLLRLLEEAQQHEDVRPFLRAKMQFRKQLEKQGFKFPGMPKEGEDLPEPEGSTSGGEGNTTNKAG